VPTLEYFFVAYLMSRMCLACVLLLPPPPLPPPPLVPVLLLLLVLLVLLVMLLLVVLLPPLLLLLRLLLLLLRITLHAGRVRGVRTVGHRRIDSVPHPAAMCHCRRAGRNGPAGSSG
jgi:hypothetical protein